MSENGGWPCARTRPAGLPAGSGRPAAAAVLYSSRVAVSPAGSIPARTAAAPGVAALTRAAVSR